MKILLALLVLAVAFICLIADLIGAITMGTLLFRIFADGVFVATGFTILDPNSFQRVESVEEDYDADEEDGQ